MKKKQVSIYLPIEFDEKLEQLAKSLVRSKSEQAVFILINALSNYDAFMECIKEREILEDNNQPIQKVNAIWL